MRAYVVDRAADLGMREAEIDAPVASRGHAVVDVHATSLNRGELLHLERYRSLPEGTVPGWDVAGVVVEAATDGAGPAVGTPVFGWTPSRGAWAERVAVRTDHLGVVPDGLSMADASTLGVAALTAYAALDRAPRPLPGARVLVTGATGGVGTFAVQLALLAGARTHAVVRDQPGATDPRQLLPAAAQREPILDPRGAPADLIIETVGGDMLTAALERVATNGTVVTLGRTSDTPAMLSPGWFLKHAQVHGLSFASSFGGVRSFGAALGQLGALVVAGSLNTNITATAHADGLVELARGVLERDIRGKAVAIWVAPERR